MPTLAWTGVEDVAGAAKIVGPRIRQLRQNRNLTIRELAARAGVSKNTVLRIEQGEPISEAGLNRICNKLQTILPNLLLPVPTETRIIQVHRASNEKWHIAFRRKRAPKAIRDFDLVADSAERVRLGGLGFVSGFVMSHDSVNPSGRLQAATVQLYGEQEEPGFRHSGEEFVYCLAGSVRLTVGAEVQVLAPGDSATFDSSFRHRYEADGPEPATILMVWYEGAEVASAVAKDHECEDY